MFRTGSGRIRAWGGPRLSAIALLLAVALAITAGCAVDNDDGLGPGPPGSMKGTCKDCHSSKEMLVATAAPDTTPPAENPGEG